MPDNRDRVLGFLTLIAVVSTVACSGSIDQPSETPLHIVTRLIDEPGDLFPQDERSFAQSAFEYRFETDADASAWNITGASSRLQTGQLLLIDQKGQTKKRAITRQVAFDAADIDFIVVTTATAVPGGLRFVWTGSGQDFSRSRQLECGATSSLGADLYRYRFDVGTHPKWRGSISRIRFAPVSASDRATRFCVIQAFKNPDDADFDQQLTEKTWRVDLGHQVRTAKMIDADRPLAYEVDVPARATLKAAFGSRVFTTGRIQVSVKLEQQNGSSNTVFEDFITAHDVVSDDAPIDGRSRGIWHDVSIDLKRWEHQSVRLVFEATPATGETAKCSVFWGDLRIVSDRRSAPPPNIVLIVVDALRADRLSLYGNPRQTSTNLDRWAKNHAATFRTVVAAAPWTLPAHLSLFTGLDTLSHGHNVTRPVPLSYHTLAEHLQHAGYRTIAVTGSAYLQPEFGLLQGFDQHLYFGDGDSLGDDLLPNLARTRELLEELQCRPYFLFFHTYEVHAPFAIRQPYFDDLGGSTADPELVDRLREIPLSEGEIAGAVRRKGFALRSPADPALQPLPKARLQEVIDAYDSAIAYTDHNIDDLLCLSDSTTDPTAVVFTSDHGEALGEHNLAGHAYLYDFNLLVPLVIGLPEGMADDLAAGTMIDDQVRQVDVLPTVLDIAGIEPPADIDGRSLLPIIKGRDSEYPLNAWSSASYQGVSLRSAHRKKYIFNNTIWQRTNATEAFFDLNSDPEESNTSSATHIRTEARTRVIKRIRETFSGLMITITNPSLRDHALQIALRDHDLTLQIKHLDAPPTSVSVTAGIASIRCSGGRSQTYLLEGVRRIDKLLVSFPGSTEVRVVDLANADHQSIEVVSSQSPLGVGFKLLENRYSAGPTLPISTQTSAQLKALGYGDY